MVLNGEIEIGDSSVAEMEMIELFQIDSSLIEALEEIAKDLRKAKAPEIRG